MAKQDNWSQWLLERRFGGDPKQLEFVLERLYPVRDKVLDHAGLKSGDVILDVGCGDGLIAFGALAREPGSRVIFSDVSQELLDHARSMAQEMALDQRCRFVRAPAEDLSVLADGTVDVITTRSVLIYVAAKQRVFGEFYRLLKPGGRLSIFEPISRYSNPEPPHLFWGYDVRPLMVLAEKVKAAEDEFQPVESCAMLDFDERDLLAMAEAAGFGEMHLDYQVTIEPRAEPVSWETWLNTAPNPEALTPAEAIQAALSPGEAAQFAAHLRPLVESGQGTTRRAAAYLWAVKAGPLEAGSRRDERA
jgi:arsenite methyltransferase